MSKNYLDIDDQPSPSLERYENHATEVSKLIQAFSAVPEVAFVCEASGGYKTRSAQQRWPVSVVNPRPIQDFAKATGTLAKTDALDAVLLDRFGSLMQPAVTVFTSESAQQLQDWVWR